LDAVLLIGLGHESILPGYTSKFGSEKAQQSLVLPVIHSTMKTAWMTGRLNQGVLMVEQISLTEGSIRPQLLKIAVPMSVGLFFNTLFNVVDTFYAGRLGTESLAGMSASFSVFSSRMPFCPDLRRAYQPDGPGTGTKRPGYHHEAEKHWPCLDGQSESVSDQRRSHRFTLAPAHAGEHAVLP